MTSPRPPGKLKWSAEEEAALRAGVAIYGKGKWRAIQKDPRFAFVLANRSNIDLKDKWRNLNIKNPAGGAAKASAKRARPPRPESQADSDAPDLESEATAQHMAVIDHVLRVVGFFDNADAEASQSALSDGGTTTVSASSTKRPDSAVGLYAPHVPTKRPRTGRRPDGARPANDDMLLAGVAVDSADRGGAADVEGVCSWVEGHFLVSPLFRDRAVAALERLVDQGRLSAAGPGRYALPRTSSQCTLELDTAAAVAAAKLTSQVMTCVLMRQCWEQERVGGCAARDVMPVEHAGLPGLAN